ncbi:rab proteins geranylgeranyltransferase component A [Biscogniauxia mediterranea]|nr:rab proteins geranylgeranyltransferase component A [Biscogniauxia mediterranea]
MESLGEETWDAVICGTGLQQSLLALALSRSKKRILHLDPNDYYGEHEAAFSLQEAETWANAHAGPGTTRPVKTTEDLPAVEEPKQQQGDSEHRDVIDERERPGPSDIEAGPDTSSSSNETPSTRRSQIFRQASVWQHPDATARGLAFPRAYTLALAPQIIHTRSKLLTQLVSSRAYRQVEFLSVGSYFVYNATGTGSDSKLARIPSSREDVFSTQSIPLRAKRSLMKFLKFVVDYEYEEQKLIWQEQADIPLVDFLTNEFKLDEDLQKYILALTLTLDGKVTVKDGLAIIHRHLTSMNLFGPGFCAVYPKWGGSSEIAQVACRAGAVGGGIYMLDTRMEIDEDAEGDEISITLSDGVKIHTRSLILSQQDPAEDGECIMRLVAVVNSPLKSLFEIVLEGAPTPAVAVIAFPSNSFPDIGADGSNNPVYAFVHSSDTGECPVGQSVVYLTTLATPQAEQKLNAALDALLGAVSPAGETPTCLYRLQYEQTVTSREALTSTRGEAPVFELPSPNLSLSFNDTPLDAVKAAWKLIMRDDTSYEAEAGYMIFQDREGMDDHDE